MGGAWFQRIYINGLNIIFKLDTGADVNCLPIKYIHEMNLKNEIVKSNL